MLKMIIILLIVAAVASLFGLPRLAGAASSVAQVLIFVALVVFLLVVVGLISIA